MLAFPFTELAFLFFVFPSLIPASTAVSREDFNALLRMYNHVSGPFSYTTCAFIKNALRMRRRRRSATKCLSLFFFDANCSIKGGIVHSKYPNSSKKRAKTDALLSCARNKSRPAAAAALGMPAVTPSPSSEDDEVKRELMDTIVDLDERGVYSCRATWNLRRRGCIQR